MQSRRALVGSLVAWLPAVAIAQASSGFVGVWEGEVEGIGAVTLFVTSVGAGGRVDGRMEFALRGHTSVFADKMDPAKATSLGIVSSATLNIETPLGGRYELRHAGDRLEGVYVRGTTYRVAVTFRRA